ncbi:MAG: rhomboid family intramembrane serine protease [Vicinamibacterales bacterium]
MFERRTSGSVVCPACGSLVGVRDEKCYTCGRANPGLWGFAPALRKLGADFGFVPLVIGASATLYALTLLMSGNRIFQGGGMFGFLSPSLPILLLFGASGAIPVFTYGGWWTVLSAGWLHGSLMHIIFNMYALKQLGPTMIDIMGPARTVIIYTVAGVTGFVLSSLAGRYLGGLPLPFFLRGAGFTVGASAPLFGLVGALVHYGNRGSSHVKQWAMSYVIGAALFGILMPGIDNYAHAGGFAGGYMMSAFLNPMTSERGDHLLAAFVCLALTALAIVASVLHGLPLFR